jgi:hypothetical protein
MIPLQSSGIWRRVVAFYPLYIMLAVPDKDAQAEEAGIDIRIIYV